MNKKISKILVCCIMILLLFSNSTHLKSIALDEVQFTVSDSFQLKKAIEQANDNDIIGITDIISADDFSIIGTNEKHITLKRMNSIASIYLGTGSYTITNITFDGNNIKSQYSFVESVQNTTISNCTFKNCIDTWEGGCINAMDKKLYINNCTFTNNQALHGGHIACNGGEYVEINDSVLSNGSAQIGGAIYSNGNLTIENTKFYNNTASTGGADIYCIGTLDLKDSIEDLQKLYPESELKPIAWVSDYNDDNSYLKLEFGIIEEENQDENNQDDTPSNNENEGNQNDVNTQNENNQNNENTENNQQEQNNSNTENTENNQQNENTNNEPEPQNTSDEENENNNFEPDAENISTPTSNDDTNNETVTNTSHNEANDNTSNTNTDESSFVQRIIDRITETFNVQKPTTQQITDDSSKSVTNKNESPVNQKIYISTSPSTKIVDEKAENSNKTESTNPSNQTFNFSLELKNDDSNNNNLLMIFIFIQSIMTFIIVIIQNKQNNRHHRYKNKKHTRKH